MTIGKLIAGAALALAMGGAAQASTIDFDELANTTGDGYVAYGDLDIDGYRFTNTQASGEQFLVWSVHSPFNADPDGATLGNNYGDTTTTVTRIGGGVFDFYAIDLGDVYNYASGGNVLFKFTDAAGETTTTVGLDTHTGLQTFVFNKTGLTSFSYRPLTTIGPFIQADNVVVDEHVEGSGAPEPGAWALMLLGFFGLGSALRTRRTMAA